MNWNWNQDQLIDRTAVNHLREGMSEFTYKYPRPSVTVDLVVFGVERGTTRVLLVRRKNKPFADRWAIPGGFVDMDEPLDDAARRELLEETGVHMKKLTQLHTFGNPLRDPRG